jgi:hypothetical protein
MPVRNQQLRKDCHAGLFDFSKLQLVLVVDLAGGVRLQGLTG